MCIIVLLEPTPNFDFIAGDDFAGANFAGADFGEDDFRADALDSAVTLPEGLAAALGVDFTLLRGVADIDPDEFDVVEAFFAAVIRPTGFAGVRFLIGPLRRLEL